MYMLSGATEIVLASSATKILDFNEIAFDFLLLATADWTLETLLRLLRTSDWLPAWLNWSRFDALSFIAVQLFGSACG
jgi:hypothetical protein